jgi:hypothetical protein
MGKGAVLLTAGFALGALLPMSAAGARPAPRCYVIGPFPKAAPSAPALPTAAPQHDPQAVVVGVPRVRCTGEHPQSPQGGGNGGGAANGAGEGSGASGAGSGGAVPFTGFEAATALVASGVLVSLGALLQRLGRRRAAPVG